MIVKKVLYEELKKRFPKQVLTFDELPKDMDKGVEFIMRYQEGKRIEDVKIRLIGIEDMYNGFKVVELNNKGDYLISMVITIHGIYKLHDMNTYKYVNHKAPESRTGKDKKEAGAKRQSLKELTDRIAGYITSQEEDITRLLGK